MTKARMDGLYLLGLGAAVFLLLGFALENAVPVTTVDFKVVYYSARCLIEHGDPYQEAALEHVYQTEGGVSGRETAANRRSERNYNYFPTAFPITVPFALMPFGPAHLLWLGVTAAGFLLASFLMWEIAADHAPIFAGVLVGLTLANSELFLILGNPAGIAVSLCVIAVWCFLRDRFVGAGIVCLALSLMLKPHDAGLVWLYFVIAGGANRKRALQTLVVVIVLSVPAIIWLSAVAPNWMPELHSILTAYSSHGDVNDPGPASMASHGIGMVVSLQAVFSVFFDDPRFYNPATYLVCGALLLAWLLKTVRSAWSTRIAWFALAPIAALTMLPVYHRIYDARLLLLAIPACAMLWQRGGGIAKSAAAVTTIQIIFTGGIAWAIFFRALAHVQVPNSALAKGLLVGLQIFPVPLILLLTACFYLWVYLRRAVGLESAQESADRR
jgi:hypothetical protein